VKELVQQWVGGSADQFRNKLGRLDCNLRFSQTRMRKGAREIGRENAGGRTRVRSKKVGVYERAAQCEGVLVNDGHERDNDRFKNSEEIKRISLSPIAKGILNRLPQEKVTI